MAVEQADTAKAPLNAQGDDIKAVPDIVAALTSSMDDKQGKTAKTDKPKAAKAGKRGAGRKRSKKAKQHVLEGQVHILATFNNTIITFTDSQGNKLCQSSAGAAGFKGSRKSTPFAAQVAAEGVGLIARDDFGVKILTVILNGPGPGREAAARALFPLGFNIKAFIDKTPVPHNGVRRPKKRRV